MTYIACRNTIFNNNCTTLLSNCSFPSTGMRTIFTFALSLSYWCQKTGNPDEQCGGDATMNLYVRGDFQFTLGPTSVLPSYNGWEKTQCWQ